MQFQIRKSEIEYRGYVRVNDSFGSKDPNVPEHLQRYRVVRDGWEDEPEAELLGYAVSKFDLPSYQTKLYPFEAYMRLAERLGLSVDETVLERQWTKRCRKVHGLRQRERIDVSGHPFYRYYRNLMVWCRKQPKSPDFTRVLRNLMRQYGGKKEEDLPSYYINYHTFKTKREELQKKWDAFVGQFAKYEEKYKKWFAEKPSRDGFVQELLEEPMYVLDKDISVTKEQIEVIERSQPIRSTIEMRHPITEEMVTILDM